MERGRASNFEDLLQRTPGLYLQTDNGTEVTRISIRGSGIFSEDEPLGVQFMLDGLTLNQGDGEAILEDFDLATIKYAEVFRGANAFKYGSITLGGAINLVTMTGREADRFSFGSKAEALVISAARSPTGGFTGPFDYVGSLMGRYRDGFRDHSTENTERIFGDLGYKFNDHLENRFYVTLDHVDRQLPGGLTKEESMTIRSRRTRMRSPRTSTRNGSSFGCRQNQLSERRTRIRCGAFWFHRNIEERGFFEEDFREGITAFYSDNYGVTLNYVTHDELFGRRNIFTIGVSPANRRRGARKTSRTSTASAEQTTALNTGISINAPLYLENQHYLTDKLSFLLGCRRSMRNADFEDDFLSDDQGDQSHEQNFTAGIRRPA